LDAEALMERKYEMNKMKMPYVILFIELSITNIGPTPHEMLGRFLKYSITMPFPDN